MSRSPLCAFVCHFPILLERTGQYCSGCPYGLSALFVPYCLSAFVAHVCQLSVVVDRLPSDQVCASPSAA